MTDTHGKNLYDFRSSKMPEKLEGNILDCRFNSMSFLLKAHGIDISPMQLLFISNSYSLSFLRINLPGGNGIIEDTPLLQIGTYNIEERILQTLNIKYEIVQVPGDREGEQMLKELLSQGKFVLTRIDTRAGSVKATDKETEKKAFRSVASPVLVDIDSRKREAVVYWTNQNDKDPLVHIPLDEFQYYRDTVCLPFSPRNECLYITDAGSVCSREQINDLFIKGVLAAAEDTVSGTPVNHSAEMEMEVLQSTFGLLALKNLCKTVEHYALKYAILPFVPVGKEVNLFFALIKMTLSHGCVFAYRHEYAVALTGIGIEVGNDALISIGQQFEGVSKLWLSLLPYSTKLQRHSKKEKRTLLSAMIVCRRIYDKERKLYPQVIQQIRRIKKYEMQQR